MKSMIKKNIPILILIIIIFLFVILNQNNTINIYYSEHIVKTKTLMLIT